MPAPNNATLYDFESAFEDALTVYFSNINGNPFNQVLNPRTVANANANTDIQLTPRLAIRAGITGVGLQENLPPSGASYESQYMGSITLDVVTQRNDPAQNHGLLRGMARVAMLAASTVLNSNSLPYYQTVQLLPQASTQFIDSDNDEIITQIVYLLEFFIPPASYANS